MFWLFWLLTPLGLCATATAATTATTACCGVCCARVLYPCDVLGQAALEESDQQSHQLRDMLDEVNHQLEVRTIDAPLPKDYLNIEDW